MTLKLRQGIKIGEDASSFQEYGILRKDEEQNSILYTYPNSSFQEQCATGTWEQFRRFSKFAIQELVDTVKIYRAYWLGDPCTFLEADESLISDYLVTSLAERVKRYHKDIPMNSLSSFDSKLFDKNPSFYEVSSEKSYRKHLKESKGLAKYDIPIIEKFMRGEKIEPIQDTAFEVTTDVLTKDEIERIYEELKKSPEPTLAFRPPNFKREERIEESLQRLSYQQELAEKEKQIEELKKQIETNKNTSNQTTKEKKENV